MARCLCIRWCVKRSNFADIAIRRSHRVQVCQQTGWGGQPVRHGSNDVDAAARLTPVTDATRLRITFQGGTSNILPWKFTPQQREVRVLPGETALAFYTATNHSDADIIGVATYSVSPGQVAPYFSKIQCFCFEEQRLNAGETVDMPVFFYIDPDFLSDPNMRNIETITLNYTFFSEYRSPDIVSDVRALMLMFFRRSEVRQERCTDRGTWKLSIAIHTSVQR